MKLFLKMMIVLLLVFPTAHSQAANVWVDKKGAIHINGSIVSGDFARFKAATTHPDFQGVVMLQSNGGYLDEALLIATYISHKGMGTGITGDCGSACSVIFMSGHKKVLPVIPVLSPRILVHTPFHISEEGEKILDTKYSNHWWLMYGIFKASGMTDKQVNDFLNLTYETPSATFRQITEKTAHSYGIETLQY